MRRAAGALGEELADAPGADDQHGRRMASIAHHCLHPTQAGLGTVAVPTPVGLGWLEVKGQPGREDAAGLSGGRREMRRRMGAYRLYQARGCRRRGAFPGRGGRYLEASSSTKVTCALAPPISATARPR